MSITQGNYINLYNNCVITYGYRFCLIINLYTSTYMRLPSEIVRKLFNGTSIEDIKNCLSHSFDNEIDRIIEIVMNNNFGYLSEHFSYQPISLEYASPSLLTNSIVDVEEDSISLVELPNIISQLNSCSCKYLLLRSFGDLSLDSFEYIVSCIEEFNGLSVQLLLKHVLFIDEDYIRKISNQHYLISRITIHTSHKEFKTKFDNTQIHYTRSKFCDHTCCGFIHPDYFSINIKSVSESLANNSCLNRKVGVDIYGRIKNCPSMKNDYGNIIDQNIESVIKSKSFRSIWKLTKDSIDDCKHCEFRHICTDCRAFTNNSDHLSKPSKCKYDPYEGNYCF